MLNPIEITAIAGLVTAVIGAIVALRRLKPEREGLVISAAQGATLILDNLTKALYAEIERKNKTIAELEARIAQLETQLEARNRGQAETP